MIRINIEDYTNIDYIYCLTYRGIDTMKDALGQGDVFECKLYQPQRCSQEILDFANFYQMHHHSHGNVIIHKHTADKSAFSFDLPLWVELENSDQLTSLSEVLTCDDVLVLCDEDELDKIESSCQQNNWNFTSSNGNLRGTEAKVVVLYVNQVKCGIGCNIGYEELTRAKDLLVIVSIRGQKRYTKVQHVLLPK